MRAIFRIRGSDSQPGLLLVEKLATPLMGMISDQICTPLSSIAINKMGNVGSTYTIFPSIFITSVHPLTPHLFFSVGASAMTQ